MSDHRGFCVHSSVAVVGGTSMLSWLFSPVSIEPDSLVHHGVMDEAAEPVPVFQAEVRRISGEDGAIPSNS